VVPGHGCVWRSLRLRARGRWVDVVPPSRDDATLLSRAQGFGSFIMAPWPNRIEGPAFEWGGVTHRLRVNAADGTAIHGDVRTRPWVVEEAAPERLVATLSTLDHPDFNFPYALRFRHELRLDGARVSLGFEVENIDARAAPVGFGFHPYFQRFLPLPGGGVEEAEIRVPARRVYPAARCLPTGPAEPVAGDLDLRRVGPIGRRALDHCFTDLERPEMECVYPTSGTRLLFELGPAYTHVVVFAPVDSQGGPRPFVALEPMTQVTNAFVLCARGWEGTGARELGPGERFGEVWSIVDAPLTPAAS
jgi:aldose 1-epimerase